MRSEPYFYRVKMGDYGKRPVFPVHPKTALAVPATGAVVHRIRDAAGFTHCGRVIYGARWLCGGDCANVVFLAEIGERPACAPCAEAASPYVYRCFDAADQLLYLGSCLILSRRIRAHQRETRWWPKVAEIRTERFSSLLAARTAEALAITAEQPRYNRVHKSRRPIANAA